MEFRDRNRDIVIESHVRPQEVVMGDDEGCHGQSAVAGFESAGWTDVVFKGSVQAFD